MTTDYDTRLAQLELSYAALQAANQNLALRLASVEARLPPVLINGKLPAVSEMTRLECQIFYTPDLSANQRKRKTIWSLKLQVWVGPKRATPDVDVALYPGDEFYRKAMHCKIVPPELDQVATAIEHEDPEDLLAGMVREVTYQGGSPYVPTQICILSGFSTAHPKVLVVIDATEVMFDGFKPGSGKKTGKSKWYQSVKF